MPPEMRSGKYIGIFTSIVLLAALLLFFTDPWSTLRKEMNRIELRSPERIDRITLIDGYDTTLLVRTAGTWMISGSEQASQVAVENLLFAASHLEIRSILAEGERAKEEGSSHILFYEGDRLIRSYDFMQGENSFALQPGGDDRLLLVSVKGYPDRDPERIFSCSVNHYREHLLIDLLPSEIALIAVDLPGKGSFRFTQDQAGDISCYRNESEVPVPPDSLDELSIRLLFSYFTDIRYERISGIPAAELTTPGSGKGELAALRVVSREGEVHTLRIFPFVKEAGEGNPVFLALVLHNETAEALVVKTIYLDVLMRDLSHYLIGGDRAPGHLNG